MTVDTSNGTSTPDSGEFWLFGYGSLIWKPPPHYDCRVPGYVTGYVRRFWQARYDTQSLEDHRGTPSAPGRVVTLIERTFWASLVDAHPAPERVWGVAYRIKADRVTEVKDYLDIREINGYSIHYTEFQPAAPHPAEKEHGQENNETAAGKLRPTIKTLVYIGTPDNEQFVGPQDPQKLAEHIHKSHGPSGPNREYLLNLDEALNQLSPPESGDAHISDLSARVRILDGEIGIEADVNGGGGDEDGDHHFHRVKSIDEQEEVEK